MNDTNSAYSAPIPSRKIRFHQRRSSEEKQNWVRRHERSGETLKQFCEQHGLALSSLCLWRRQLTQRSGKKDGRKGGALVEVPLRTQPAFGADTGSHRVAIHLPGGTCIEVGVSAEIEWLAELVRTLRGMEYEG